MSATNNTQATPQAAMPIAVVGMSCRLSGDVSNTEDFWTLLSRSRDGWTEIPEDRFANSSYYHPNPQKKGCFNQKGGYFIKNDFSKFDAPFFQITKQEAEAMGMSCLRFFFTGSAPTPLSPTIQFCSLFCFFLATTELSGTSYKLPWLGFTWW